MFIRLWHIYYDGFSHLPKWGKILIAIVVAKLLVLFVVFKLVDPWRYYGIQTG